MSEPLPGLATPDKTAPSLPGWSDGLIGRDPWVVVCRDCGTTASDNWLFRLVAMDGFHFHSAPWPDGTNPRLCRACRLARGCDCYGCEVERHGTEYPKKLTV